MVTKVPEALLVRTLVPADHNAVLAIYNHYIEHSPATFDTQTFTAEQRRAWFNQFDQPPYRCLVAERDGEILGYACAQRFKEKPAYATSVETSIYVSHEHLGSGIGGQLYNALFTYLETQDFHRAYAGITLPNDGSIALHEKFGYRRVGLYTEVGYKYDRYWDVAWFEKILA